MSRTNKINVRTLNPDEKNNIRKLLRHGDLARISERCDVGYRQVSGVIKGRCQNDRVWEETLKYLNELREVEIDTRLAKIIAGETEAA